MERFNVYIDGTWLFRQCDPNRVFANRMEYPDSRFGLSFPKLIDALGESLGGDVERGDLFFYTSLFEFPSEPDPEWAADAEKYRPSIEKRERFTAEALEAGFASDGVFRVPLRGWIVERLNNRSYREKMVDTAVVARLVERAIAEPQTLHVLVAGDGDMVPAIGTVVPNYSRTVVLACTHPDQYLPGDAQSSYRLAQLNLDRDPIYLDQMVDGIVKGEHVYQCSNPRCNSWFARGQPIPRAANPVCKPCHERKIGR